MKIKNVFSIIGFFFLFIYFIYVGGYSTTKIFEYSLFIALFFLTVDLIIYLLITLKAKK